nr:putative integron gene cassette protein [uncultured bacterium]
MPAKLRPTVSTNTMGWASKYIEQLHQGKTVQFRPRGNSMLGKIESGQLCTVEPLQDADSLKVGDIVLCKVGGNQYIHLVKAIQGNRFQIGNNRGRINGWITANSTFGKCIRVET